MNPTLQFDASGYFLGELPDECVADCSAPGSVDASVAYWRRKLGFEVPPDQAIAYLAETGAWTRDELAEETGDTLAQRVLWLACCDIRETGEWFGMVR